MRDAHEGGLEDGGKDIRIRVIAIGCSDEEHYGVCYEK